MYTQVGVEHCGVMGRGIGGCAVDLCGSLQPTHGSLGVANRTIAVRRRPMDPDLVAWAHRHEEIPSDPPPQSDYGTEVANAPFSPPPSPPGLITTSNAAVEI